MKILTLRIYNHTPDYDNMYDLHMQYDTNSVFLIASPDILEATYDPKTKILTVPGNESLVPGILQKTIKGVKYCLDNFEFDILIRSNMSTIVNYSELEKQLITIPSIYGGHVWKYFILLKYYSFISGCCTVMDKEVCNYLVNTQHSLLYSLEDDVAIGKLLSNRFPITFTTRYSQTKTITPNTCFYRFRQNTKRYDQRESDIFNMTNFYKLLSN